MDYKHLAKLSLYYNRKNIPELTKKDIEYLEDWFDNNVAGMPRKIFNLNKNRGKTMKFIENFPELKGLGLPDSPDIDTGLADEWWQKQHKTENDVVCYFKEHIEKYCLSKQRVKKAIENLVLSLGNIPLDKSYNDGYGTGWCVALGELTKELGLEND